MRSWLHAAIIQSTRVVSQLIVCPIIAGALMLCFVRPGSAQLALCVGFVARPRADESLHTKHCSSNKTNPKLFPKAKP